jgi:lipopolysaccharide export LptBFGC system permease protein LptF
LIFKKISENKTKIEQKYIYKKLINILEIKYKNNFYINYIIKKIKQKNNSIILEKKVFKKHQTKILKFSRNTNHNFILNNFKIKNNEKKSVFIFKKYKNLSKKDINFITKKLINFNKNILIFIDQE